MNRRLKIGAGMLLLVLLFSLSMTGCSGKNLRTVALCAGYEVPYEELRYLTLSCRDLLKERDDAPQEDSAEYRAELERMIPEKLAEDYTVLALAKTYLPERSPDDSDILAYVDTAVEEAIELSGGKSEFKNYLKSVYMTEHLLRFHLACAKIEEELTDAIFRGSELENESAFAEWLDAGNYARVRRITAPDAETAERIRQRLNAGSGPEEAVTGETGVDLTAGFYLVRGLAEDAELEAEAFALERVGSVSGVTQTADGYRVLVRLDNDPDRMMALQASGYRNRLRQVRLDEILAQVADSVTVEWTAYGAGIDLLTVR